MALVERLTAPQAKPTLCIVGRLLATLAPADAEVLRVVLVDPGFTSAHIHRALRDEGHRVGLTAVKTHRTGGCSCGAL